MGISVTDLSAQLWCEKQFEFSLEKGRIETEEMSKGKGIHRKLHEEVAHLVPVETVTSVDRIALAMYNNLSGIKRLLSQGMTRELMIFGKINSLFVVGKIDELAIKNNRVFLMDTKTRQKDSMPSEAQKRTTRFQLTLYNKLLQNIIKNEFTTTDLLDFYGINANEDISKEFEKQIKEIVNSVEPNVQKLAEITFTAFRKIPFPEKSMRIRYEYQQNRKFIGNDDFLFDLQSFQRDCNFVEEFWVGKRKAIPVGINNAWKCNFCEFNAICDVKPKNKF